MTYPLPLFTRIDHVGIAVRNLEEAIGWYETTYGLTVTSRETNESQGVHEAMLVVKAPDPGRDSAARTCSCSSR